jgi:putative DNA methylase
MTGNKPKKLIEVALPIKEISAESVRDKSIRHGHISTLHLWWARRPLPVCRAVVFASLVPDPLDENCPQAFIDAVNLLLAKDPNTRQDPYKPYDDIPYTAAIDPMEDNLRNRLLMFIGKFSDQFIQKGGKVPAKDLIHDACLIKWDNKNDEKILNIARKLIWVAHNAGRGRKKMPKPYFRNLTALT